MSRRAPPPETRATAVVAAAAVVAVMGGSGFHESRTPAPEPVSKVSGGITLGIADVPARTRP